MQAAVHDTELSRAQHFIRVDLIQLGHFRNSLTRRRRATRRLCYRTIGSLSLSPVTRLRNQSPMIRNQLTVNSESESAALVIALISRVIMHT